MKAKYADVLSAALKLGKRDRQQLVAEVTVTFAPREADADFNGPLLSMDGLTDAEFEAELNRRHEEVLRDPSVMVDAFEVIDRLLEEARRETSHASAGGSRLRASGSPLTKKRPAC